MILKQVKHPTATWYPEYESPVLTAILLLLVVWSFFCCLLQCKAYFGTGTKLINSQFRPDRFCCCYVLCIAIFGSCTCNPGWKLAFYCFLRLLLHIFFWCVAVVSCRARKTFSAVGYLMKFNFPKPILYFNYRGQMKTFVTAITVGLPESIVPGLRHVSESWL